MLIKLRLFSIWDNVCTKHTIFGIHALKACPTLDTSDFETQKVYVQYCNYSLSCNSSNIQTAWIRIRRQVTCISFESQLFDTLSTATTWVQVQSGTSEDLRSYGVAWCGQRWIWMIMLTQSQCITVFICWNKINWVTM